MTEQLFAMLQGVRGEERRERQGIDAIAPTRHEPACLPDKLAVKSLALDK